MSSFVIGAAKHRLCELIERAARGEEIIIARRGKAVARLLALPKRAPRGAREVPGPAIAQRIRRSRAGHPLHAGVVLRELIDEGRQR